MAISLSAPTMRPAQWAAEESRNQHSAPTMRPAQWAAEESRNQHSAPTMRPGIARP
ncbi:hypothetical protein JF732_23595 [Mycobacterium intracellulare]|uniref:Uncharacterized protein n=1 Tax=Mycobacterium intracellulare TaxID=1767 RepID=A0AAE4RB95_MYCIT|nr:hypothetical protein [Mycobacterium intracellulare]ETZ30018.1 hypothetical protein L842_2365 [Mycobacterium intracellulare MIN_052511_1280]MCA2322921.1 hypothetical protein [Mycobacterium intracellulare]MCA2343513.1 hypothetical protein [Mycobacterium intracellulare]MDV6975609.1 hypothetical protein [Mycobacterium intracellulare]MDV6981968.1 hypothetical protein [Mycobacterium intracellulare]